LAEEDSLEFLQNLESGSETMATSQNLIDTYIGLRSRIARLVVGIVPPKEVEDIVQETYVRVCQINNKEKIRDPQSFLFRTARNLALDHLKRAETRLTSGSVDIDIHSLSTDKAFDDQTYSAATSNEEFGLFCDAVRHLPKQCRRAFVLKKVYGYTLREISEEMGIGQPTVETHIVTGTKKCVRYLRELEAKSSLRGQESTFRGVESQRGEAS
jgi:RNA polymerase sigma-70 factor (ECF subfamily)